MQLLEIECSKVREQHEHRDEEAEVADAVDDERFLAGVRVRFLAEPETDQQIRAKTDAFPPDEHHRVIRSEDEHEHEEHEQVQIREVPRIAWILAHVADAEDVDQRSDARDDEQHHERELVEHQRRADLQVPGGDPHEVRLNERLVRLGGDTLVLPEDDSREQEGENQNGGADEARDAREAMSRGDVGVSMSGRGPALVTGVRRRVRFIRDVVRG